MGPSDMGLMDTTLLQAYLMASGQRRSDLVEWDDEVDARGLLCPLPVLKARKRLKAMAQGQVLKLLATDPAAVIDVPHFCNEGGHTLVLTEADGPAQAYFIRRGS